MTSLYRALAALIFVLWLAPTLQAQQPNFVLFVVDDLGFMDIGANNPQTFYETPRVDQLAAEGMRFAHAYAANPVCSPTRFSIMTGRYPTRVAATNWFSGAREGRFRPARLNDCMPRSEFTIAESLAGQGYRTAFVGKWHLGPTAEFWPEAQGFQINIGGHDRGSPPGGYFAPFRNPRLADGPDGEHLTTRLTDEALQIIDSFGDQPFLLVFAFYTVHTPLQAPPELIEKYRRKAESVSAEGEFQDEEQIWPVEQARKVRAVQRHATYAAMVETMDHSVGRVLDKLREAGIDDRTVVMFTSDNGGLSTSEGSPTSNLPLRGGKGWLYEGGIRVPLIVKWPGQPAGQVCDRPVMTTDLFPTIQEIAEVHTELHPDVDGVSLAATLRGDGEIADRPLFWHYPHYSNQGGFPGGGVRIGDYKLLERFEDGQVHLYDLKNDPGERNDLAAARPEQVQQMRQQLHTWYDHVGAQFLRAKVDGPEPWRPAKVAP